MLPAQDALGVSAFSTSQEAFAAEDLFDAYRSGDAAAVRAVAAKPLFKTIDNQARAALCLKAACMLSHWMCCPAEEQVCCMPGIVWLDSSH